MRRRASRPEAGGTRSVTDKLKGADVKVAHAFCKGVTHEFFGMGPAVPEAERAEDLAAKEEAALTAKRRGRPTMAGTDGVAT